MQALVVSTALKPGSKTLTAARAVAAELAQRGFAAEVANLAETPLPMCDGAVCYQDAQVQAMTARVAAVQLVVLCFPVYNYQPNAAAKNFVELTNSGWPGKVVAFVANAGGDRSYLAPLPLANSLMVDHGCVVVPEFLYFPPACYAADQSLAPDVDMQRRFTRQMDAAARLAAAWTAV